MVVPRPRNTAKPTLAKRGLKVDRLGRVAFTVRCPGCQRTLTLKWAGKTLGTVRFAGSRTVRVKLPARLRRKTLHARAVLSVTVAGHEGTVARTLKITIRGRR